MTLGERIAKCRKDKNLSQEYVAERLDVSRQAVSKWENDLNAPDTYNLIALARLFDVSVEYLACGEEKSNPEDDKKIPPTPKTEPAEKEEHHKPKSCFVMAIGFLIAGFGATGCLGNLLFPLLFSSSFSLVNFVVCGILCFAGLKIMDLV